MYWSNQRLKSCGCDKLRNTVTHDEIQHFEKSQNKIIRTQCTFQKSNIVKFGNESHVQWAKTKHTVSIKINAFLREIGLI